MELYGLSPAEETVFTANRVRQVVGPRRINLDELLEGLAALDGKTSEDARADLFRLRQAYTVRGGDE